MKKSKSVDSLYAKHKEERENYRLALDLEKQNWLLEKLKTTNSKLTKRERNLLKRINKKIQNANGNLATPKMAQKRPIPQLKSIDSTPGKLQKIINNDKTGNESIAGQCMPDVTDVGTTKSYSEKVDANQFYQVEPLALLNKKTLSKTESSYNSEIDNKPSIIDLSKNTNIDLSKKDQNSAEKKSIGTVVNMEKNYPKPICLSVLPPKPKNWFDTKEQIFSKHNLPLSVAPEMKKYRNFRQPTSQPTNVNKKTHTSRESQTDMNDDIVMLQYLHAKEIITVEKLIDFIESLKTPKINEEDSNILEFLKTKGIKLQMLTEIISDADKLKEVIGDEEDKIEQKNGDEDEDEVEFVKEEIVSKTKVNPELIDSLVALSAENKKLISFCSTKAAITRILTQVANSKYNEEAKNKLEEAERALKNQSVIIQNHVSEMDALAIKPVEITPAPQKTSYNVYDEPENEKEEDSGHLVIEDIGLQVINIGDKGIEDTDPIQVINIGVQGIEDTGPQVTQDIVTHIVEDTGPEVVEDGGFQIAESHNVTNIVDELVVQNTGLPSKGSPVVLLEPEKPSAPELDINALTIFEKSMNVDCSNLIKRTPKLRGNLQMGARARQMCPPENKRRYMLRDPRYKNRPQVSRKAVNFNHIRPLMVPGFYLPNTDQRQIRPNSFNNGTAGPVNQNMGFDPNNEIRPNGPYQPNNQNNNNIAYGPDSKNYDGSGYGPNAQYGNSGAYSQNKRTGVIKRYGPRGQNNNVIYNPNNQNNSNDSIFNSSCQNNMSGGAYSQNSQASAFDGFSQSKMPGLSGLGGHNQNSFHSSLNSVHHGQKGSLGLNAQGVAGSNVQNSDNDPRGSMGQNIFWGSAGQHLPPTTVANTGPPLQWPATSMGNLTGMIQPPYTPARMSPTSLQHVTPESLWKARRWPQM